ncbi:MAG: alpha/beta hydrolase [Gammaproteobacteria bacterium]|nr:alpha/beta hydrolase [Gammaproteobacteria bacterium]
MTHQFMEQLANDLADARIATLRFNFPYKEHGGRRPDREAVLLETVRAAVATGREAARRLPVFVGGKSMGGRMASRAMAAGQLDVEGIVFFGFPLHVAGKPNVRRAAHLTRVQQPMLFLQGTRDRLADLELMRHVVADLGELATLHVIDGADHSFNMLKRSGRTAADAVTELAQRSAEWMMQLGVNSSKK